MKLSIKIRWKLVFIKKIAVLIEEQTIRSTRVLFLFLITAMYSNDDITNVFQGTAL